MSGSRHLQAVDGNDPGEGGAAPLPHDIAAEQVVLGAVMLSPAALIEVRDILSPDGTEFYRPAHQIIWTAVLALADRGEPHDPLAVVRNLGRDLPKVGGGPYVHTLVSHVPTAVQAPYYAHAIRDLAYARRVAETGTRIAQLATAAPADGAVGELRSVVAAEVAPLTAADVHGWGEPAPLSSTWNLPEYPLTALPRWLGDYVAGLSDLTQTPPDLAGCLALSVLGVAAAGKVWVAAPAWREPTNLFTVVALPPGNRKSEVYRAMCAPIVAAEQALVEQARPRIAEAMVNRRMAEVHAERAEREAENAIDYTDTNQKAAALSDAADARMALDDATVPAEPRLFSDDATVERLTTYVSEQGGRFAVLSPEGEVFSIAAGRYSGTPNFAILKKGHAGEQVRVDRVGRPPELIDAATVTLGICTQPSVLEQLGQTPQFRGEGLLGRLLYSVPESLLGYRNTESLPIPAAIDDTYQTNVKALILTLNDVSPAATLEFTDDGKRAVTQMLTDTEPRFRPDGDLAHMTDWGGKLVGATVRIAGLLHLAEHFRDGWHTPITADTFTNARQLADYFTDHAKAAYDRIGADPAVADARALLNWARNTGAARFTARDAMRANKSRFAKVADLDPALRVLESHGWIRRLPDPPKAGRGRPAAPMYDVHPNAHAQATEPDHDE